MEIKKQVNQVEIHDKQVLSSGKSVIWRAAEGKEKVPAVVESYFVNIPDNQVEPKPISILSALVAGFDRIAAKPLLILPSLLLDLFLWFGPHLTVPSLLHAAAAGLSIPAGADPGITEQLALFREALDLFSERYNLLTAFSTLPGGMPFNFLFALLTSVSVGIPSLVAGRMPLLTPLGQTSQLEILDPMFVLSLWFGLALAGIGAGAIFHRLVAQQVDPEAELGHLWRDWMKLVLLAVGGYLLTVVVLTIGMLVAAIDGLAYIALPVLFVAGVYLAFTPHGIIRYRLGIWNAVKQSIRVVRFNFFGSSGYLLTAFLIMWVSTSNVWSLAQEDSWIFALAIMGHAFIATMLIAGSYVFFQGRKDWLEWQLARIVNVLNQEKPEFPDE
ncbi:MAG: hypothetical protein E3J30_05490 [Anaerolineales bacterium]|nr:MAG: hypothetical protein E3J30_05490 [Anaerolineales bacterium]